MKRALLPPLLPLAKGRRGACPPCPPLRRSCCEYWFLNISYYLKRGPFLQWFISTIAVKKSKVPWRNLTKHLFVHNLFARNVWLFVHTLIEYSPGSIVELFIFSLILNEVAENPAELPAMHVNSSKSFFVILLKWKIARYLWATFLLFPSLINVVGFFSTSKRSLERFSFIFNNWKWIFPTTKAAHSMVMFCPMCAQNTDSSAGWSMYGLALTTSAKRNGNNITAFFLPKIMAEKLLESRWKMAPILGLYISDSLLVSKPLPRIVE